MKMKEVHAKISEHNRVTTLSKNMCGPVSISFIADSWIAQ